MNIAPEDRVKVKLECLRLLATMKLNPAKMQLISGFVDSYLKLSRAEFEQFQEEVQEIVPAEREAVMEIYNDWMLKGMEQGWYKGVKEGLLQGRDEGRHEEGAALVLRLLRRRVGELSPTQERRIKRLSIEQLEELGEALLDFSSPQDLKKWLSALKK
jgi:flagellar biosynthesis/type III secretory pathway protein FliH